MKTNQFYNLEYIPNKTVFVYSIDKKEIRFLAFLSENKEGLKAIKHGISIDSKKDFKPVKKCFNPNEKIKELINNELVYQL